MKYMIRKKDASKNFASILHSARIVFLFFHATRLSSRTHTANEIKTKLRNVLITGKFG